MTLSFATLDCDGVYLQYLTFRSVTIFRLNCMATKSFQIAMKADEKYVKTFLQLFVLSVRIMP